MVDCFGVLSVLVWLRLASSSAHKAWSVIAIRNQTESRPLLSPLFGRLCCDWLLASPFTPSSRLVSALLLLDDPIHLPVESFGMVNPPLICVSTLRVQIFLNPL